MEVTAVFVLYQVFNRVAFQLPLPQNRVDIGGEHTLWLLIILSTALEFVGLLIVNFTVCDSLKHIGSAVRGIESHSLRVVDIANAAGLPASFAMVLLPWRVVIEATF